MSAIAEVSAGSLSPAERAESGLERRRAQRRHAGSALAIAGALVLGVLVAAAVGAPWVTPHDPSKQSLARRLTPPAWTERGHARHLLGTDQVGRDVLSRLILGARISLAVGVSAVALSTLIGVALGLAAGFSAGRLDTAIMTVVDVMLSFPPLLLALAFAAALDPSLWTVIVVLGLTGWERYARVVRAEVLALRERDFVQSARALGAGPARVILRHLLPNTLSSVIVLSTLGVAQAILQEAALSFLGVGGGGSQPSWGQMVAQGRDVVTVAWWLPTFPGLAILATVLAINLVGDRLRDALDPRTR